ncbi:MAG: ChbG/HpnK family deacetylase [Tractidigestivibacter sp.]|jgi:predicted glycoside hydrolase/deacetylase ChbG (UPF0249 family)|uniref:ChbG/HpnK family deacetylase n=1 Tax=Tractidigestivibacter sp. TaxID=2847320 RepID=UPI003D92A905
MKLIIRADDLGYSEAVNRGIEKSVRRGLVRSVGVMPNMEQAQPGLEMLEGCDVAFGQHTNVCLGRPCADPAAIPTLVDENGMLHSSREYRAAWKEGRELAATDDLVREIEAQYQRFVELVGHDPDYFEAHAVMSKNLHEALAIVAEKYHLRWLDTSPVRFEGTFAGKPIAMAQMGSMDPGYDARAYLYKTVGELLNTQSADVPVVYVCHPGWLDEFILTHSSLTVNRTKEVEMLCDPAVAAWLRDRNVELLDFRDV